MKAATPHVSAGVTRVFAAYTRRFVRKHFHALRILERGLPPRDCARPLVIYLNHASWWDPLVCLLLVREFFADRTSFAPIDAPMLERYGFFRHLGFFGVEQDTPRGALTFLRTARALLASSKNAVWLTPQGRFTDVRERPLRLKDGLGALATREPGAAFIPLAIEFAFWTESRPEILVSFGEPIVPDAESARSAADWTRALSPAHSRRRRMNSPPAPAAATPPSGARSTAASPASAASTTPGAGCARGCVEKGLRPNIPWRWRDDHGTHDPELHSRRSSGVALSAQSHALRTASATWATFDDRQPHAIRPDDVLCRSRRAREPEE